MEKTKKKSGEIGKRSGFIKTYLLISQKKIQYETTSGYAPRGLRVVLGYFHGEWDNPNPRKLPFPNFY